MWRYKLTFVGGVLSVCSCAWSRLALHMLEGEQELEKRAAVFRTSASFWGDWSARVGNK